MTRSTTRSYVLRLKLNTDAGDAAFLEKRYLISNKIYNQLITYLRKQILKLRADHTYKLLMSQWQETKNGKRPSIKAKHAEIAGELKVLRLKYGLSEYQIHSHVVTLQHTYKKYVSSDASQLIASDAWRAVQSVLFGNGKSIHYRKFNELTILYGGKKNSNGIRFTGKSILIGKYEIPVCIDRKDTYVMQALKSRVKYCRITRLIFPNGYHYYADITMEGTPPIKFVMGSGRIGIDIGTSTIAAVHADGCLLQELGEDAPVYKKEIIRINRAMERSRRSSNPDNYNQDGTVKKSPRYWYYSKSYKKLASRNATLKRKQAAGLRQTHNQTVNGLLSHGDIVYVEEMNFRGLQKRASKTTKTKKGRIRSKKRYGVSIKQHAPAMFISIMNKKLGYMDRQLQIVNTNSFKASQYCHITDDYVKKRLSDRYTVINGKRIQRDLYSAFLLANSDPEMKHADRVLCFDNYEYFVTEHDNRIAQMKNSGRKYPSCCGLKYFAS